MSPSVTDPPRRALVTGASRGIGKGIALALAGDGHSVACSSRNGDALERTAAEAVDAGAPQAVALPADLGELGAGASVAREAAGALGGPVEILVHCSGMTGNAPVSEVEDADWERTMRVNAGSLVSMAREATPSMREAGWGRVVAIGSLYSRMGVARTAGYTASKHAVLGIIRVLSAELVGHGATANAILPGFVDTEMVRDEVARAAEARGLSEEDVLKKFLRIQPIGRTVRVDEVGCLAAFLCSEAAAAISGQGIHIDGGAVQA